MQSKWTTLKDNYIVKALRRYPIIFVTVFVLSALLTYQITSFGISYHYEKIIDLKEKIIQTLEKELSVFKNKIEDKNIEVVEKYDKKTGKLISKTKKEISKTKTKIKTKEKTKVDTVVERESKEVIKETKKFNKNTIYGGIEYNLKLEKRFKAGYMRKFGPFGIGIDIGIDPSFDFDNSSIGINLGVDF